MSRTQQPITKKKKPGSAIISPILGLFSFFGLGPLTAIPAIIYGHISLRKMKNSGLVGGKVLALVGLLLGYLNMALVGVILFLFVYLYRTDLSVATGASVSYSLVHGKRIYELKCASCHGEKGEGNPPKYPSLRGSEWVIGPEEYLIKIVMNGINDQIGVKGESYVGEHPAFTDQLLNRDISSVITFIRRSWGNQATPVSQSTVGQWRLKIGNRSHAWTSEELLNGMYKD